ncbi:hypothetical protein [Sinisalibacter aestuarii]|uniref:Uncharacterized protein n=1 Tax=Sinisalibacter aestuarii TaxID=2949426 RepID=A0ABQ5LNS9_9RHOB|nr:hypothetical protein [Sinisalibacter aestuarii]GKY86283.1 hypothetical protein STA1M1_01520 [Sinisalibacter aestuarii]
MQTNVIAFTARPARPRRSRAPYRGQNNVIPLADWLGRAMPHRTPTGVFFTTRVLVAPGEIA